MKKSECFRGRKCIFRILSLMVIFCFVVVPLNVNAYVNSNELEKAKESPEEFVASSISMIAESLPEEGWNENTSISEKITTYDLDGKVNGYIFNVKTLNEHSGFIQIFVNRDDYYVISYSFQGKHFIIKNLEVAKDKLKLNENNKILYLGNNEFVVLENNSTTEGYSLTSMRPVKLNEEVRKVYQRIKNKIIGYKIPTIKSDSPEIKKYIKIPNKNK